MPPQPKTSAPRKTKVKTPAKRAPKPNNPPKRTAAPSKKTPPTKRSAPAPHPPPANPQALALAHHIAQQLLEKKASNIIVFNVYNQSSYADVIVLASGESERHLSSLSKHLWESLKEKNVRPISVEGTDVSSWVLMDFGDVVVHLFSPEIRALYDLDGLWSDAPREYFH
ncbi:MAG: ribosome silencing factor [Cystobacterineae bacterium]|nr:ribosome silencing factor [Cystobacterineae bacterium]